MTRKATPEPDVTTIGCVVLAFRAILLLLLLASGLWCLGAFSLQFLKSGMHRTIQTWLGVSAAAPLAALLKVVRTAVPKQVAGLDIAPMVALLVVYLLRTFLDSLLAGPGEHDEAKTTSPRPAPRGSYPPGRRVAAATQPSEPAPAAYVAPASYGPAEDHLEVLKRIAEGKKEIEKLTGKERDAAVAKIKDDQAKLQAMKKTYAFMAGDIVGSTKLKAGEKAEILEHAFLSFRKWADDILKENKVWKASWTPDGVMAAFPDVNGAAGAARAILYGLRQFNKEGHQLSTALQIRLGVSLGEVLFPEKASMDEVTDKVIDLAGHLQKYAEPDTLLMTVDDVHKLKDQKGFRSTHRQVDGFDVLEWKR